MRTDAFLKLGASDHVKVVVDALISASPDANVTVGTKRSDAVVFLILAQ